MLHDAYRDLHTSTTDVIDAPAVIQSGSANPITEKHQ